MDNDLHNQRVKIIGGQDKLDDLEAMWDSIPSYINRVGLFKDRAKRAGFNHNQIMCFLEM